MIQPELTIIPGRWDFQYSYFAGETASRFFNALRDERRIYGTNCRKCGKVLVPARSFCDACFVETDEWVAVGPGGRLNLFTIVATQFPGLPAPPFVIGYATLDGANTAILNFVRGIDLTDLDAAASLLMTNPRVHAEFSELCEGRITDFYFRVVQE